MIFPSNPSWPIEREKEHDILVVVLQDCCVFTVYSFVFFTGLLCIQCIYLFYYTGFLCVQCVYHCCCFTRLLCIHCVYICCFFRGLLCIHCIYICCFSQDCCVSTVYIQHVTPNQAPEQLMAKNLDTGEFCRVDLIGFTTPYSRGQITKADLSEVWATAVQ